MGSCTAGGAYVPAMSDETIIVKGTGTIFIGGPPLVKAATGQDVTAEELGGADVHTRRSGVADHYATLRRARARARPRRSCRNLHRPPKDMPWDLVPAEEPAADPADLYGLIPEDYREPFDRARGDRADRRRLSASTSSRSSTARRSSAGSRGSRAFRSAILANNGVLFAESAQKGAHFIELACKRKMPLVFLQNITGFMVGKEYEAGGIARDGAKLVMAVACAEVPKFTVVIGGSFGAGQLRHVRPRVLAAAALDVAERAHLGDGRRAGGDGADDGRRRGSRRDPGEVRARRATRTTRPPGSGTTGSSTRSTLGACWRSGSRRR
mgnify:CR=1 FL=1